MKIFASATEFLSLQQVAQILSDLIFFDMLLRQNSVAKTKIFSKILQYARSDLSLRRVAATWSCNLSPTVYRPLDTRTCRQFRQRLFFEATISLERVPSQSKRHKSSNRPLSFIFIITIIIIIIIIIIVTINFSSVDADDYLFCCYVIYLKTLGLEMDIYTFKPF